MRWLTKTIFGQGSTIDGNRIDRAIGDVVARFNALRGGDRAHRWFENRYVSGYQAQLNGQSNHPFELAEAVSDDEENQHKWKGYLVAGLTGAGAAVSVTAWAFTSMSSKPSRLRRITVFLQDDETNDWLYGTTPPPGSSTRDGANDFTVEVLVSNPFAVENREQAALAVLREQFRATSVFPMKQGLGLVPLGATSVPMPWTQLVSMGLCIDIECDVLIPPFARVTCGLLLPDYAGTAYNTPWPNGKPWLAFHGSSWTVVTQESL